MADESDLPHEDTASLMGFEYETAMEDTEVCICAALAPLVHLADLGVV
jgi:hypothetical protein